MQGVSNQQRETDIVLVLDSSGSMYDMVNQTISGVNSAIAMQRAAASASYSAMQFVSFLTFSSHDKIITKMNRVPLAQWKDITSEDYCPQGLTALYDAAKAAFSLDIPAENRVIYIFVTDGESNDDRVWSSSNLRATVDGLQHSHLDESGVPLRSILYIGCQDGAMATANSCGVSHGCSLQYDAQRTPEMWQAVGRTVASYSSGGSSFISPEDRLLCEDMLARSSASTCAVSPVSSPRRSQ